MDISKLENMRKKARNSILTGIILSLLIFIMLLCLTQQASISMILFIISIIITYIVSLKQIKEFNLSFRNAFILRCLKNTFDDLIYDSDKGLDESIIRDTNMIHMGDQYSSKNLISAKYKNVKVIQSDVHIEERRLRTNSDGKTTVTYITIFKGRWMVFNFNKNFNFKLQVCQKKFYNSKISNFGAKLKFKKILLEDEEFNKKFTVYAQDEHEAFYILTPSMIQRIKNIIINLKGKVILCFIDNKLHVGIQNGKSSFNNHNVFKKINVNKVKQEILGDIELVTQFVDKLNLDNDLFRKVVN